MCEVRRQNLAIFGGDVGNSLTYLGACIHDTTSAIRCVALQGYSSQCRVRGHYQRLVLAEHVDVLREKWKKTEAEAQERRKETDERRRMEVAE